VAGRHRTLARPPPAFPRRRSIPEEFSQLAASRSCAGARRPGCGPATGAVLDAVGSKLDGKAASVTYTARRRAVLWNLYELAVEKTHLIVNPITTIKWTQSKVHNADVVDPATVPNPQQAKALLAAVAQLPGSGPRMVAFFACMYYAALRPGEAVDLTKANLHLPDKGRGKLYLTGSNPFAGSAWTDSGEDREQRGLKHREQAAGRWPPCPARPAPGWRTAVTSSGSQTAGTPHHRMPRQVTCRDCPGCPGNALTCTVTPNEPGHPTPIPVPAVPTNPVCSAVPKEISM
jgi:hypothetical protein